LLDVTRITIARATMIRIGIANMAARRRRPAARWPRPGKIASSTAGRKRPCPVAAGRACPLRPARPSSDTRGRVPENAATTA
jgi:hypothetical protein